MKKMFFTGGLAVALASLVLAIGATAETPAKAPPGPAAKTEARQLTTRAKPWTGDFDGMLERRVIRVLVPTAGRCTSTTRGPSAASPPTACASFERWINKKYAKQLGKRPITVFIVPTTRDKLLPEVIRGLGDIAVGNLTVTEDGERKTVDFVSLPDQTSVNELVVTGPKSPAIATVDDLAGKTVHVRKSSSYYESLTALNGRFAKEGKPAVKIVLVPDALEDEDMLEMLNAGLLEAIVVDDWKAKMWAQILPKIKVNEQAVVEGRRADRLGDPQGEPEAGGGDPQLT